MAPCPEQADLLHAMTDMYSAAPCNGRMPYADKDTSLSSRYVHKLMKLLEGLEEATKANSTVCRLSCMSTALARTGLKFLGLEVQPCTPRRLLYT